MVDVADKNTVSKESRPHASATEDSWTLSGEPSFVNGIAAPPQIDYSDVASNNGFDVGIKVDGPTVAPRSVIVTSTGSHT